MIGSHLHSRNPEIPSGGVHPEPVRFFSERHVSSLFPRAFVKAFPFPVSMEVMFFLSSQGEWGFVGRFLVGSALEGVRF